MSGRDRPWAEDRPSVDRYPDGVRPEVPFPRTPDNCAPPASPRPGTSRVPQSWGWERGYVPLVITADLVCAALAMVAAYALRFGDGATGGESAIHLAASVVLPVLWVGTMLIARSYEPRFLGLGSEEYRRVLVAASGFTAVVALLAYFLAVDLARGYVVIALPVATLLTLLARYRIRKRLHRRRSRSGPSEDLIAVGHVAAVEALTRQVHSARYHGMRIQGACVPSGQEEVSLTRLGVPVLGTFDDVITVVRRTSADAIAVLPCPELDGPRLRRLGWELEGTTAALYVAPAVMEVVGPRISIRPVCGLPLLHVERPEFVGVRRLAKATFDRAVGLAALVVVAPLLLVVGVALLLESRGPVVFRQHRVGKDGRPFVMYKLRTMVADAESRLAHLKEHDEGNGVLFKIRDDPRVTRLGRVLRRYSIDELPQLINVLRGDMSLVGPRPPLPSEVERYRDDMHRRFLVRPGLTGLWQINGRSNLDWDESVRLDLRYVENWSLAFDFMILWKTGAAVLRGRGAY